MAPVAAASRPPGRPKLRSKIDGRLGLPALYTARNLDRCTRQLGHWNPFASSAAVSPEHNPGDPVTDNATVVRNSVGLQPERNPNLGSRTDIAHPTLASAFRSAAVSLECPDCGQFPVDNQLHPRSKGPRGFDPLPTDSFGEPAVDWFKRAAHSSSDKGIFEFGKVSTTECDARAVQERRVHGWSKRRKQLSHALARGLWRWKDGFHARKRMKRCGPGGGRNSGSDKSSDRAPYGVHASDPSTAPTSKAGPFKWSDFPVTPTDSSGELFGGGSSNLMAEMNALGKDWTACGCSRAGNDTSGSKTTDCDQCWLRSENSSAMESGYGSEPGYRGDEELEFGDIDEEQDEDEIEPQHLRIWTQVMARSSSHAMGQAQLETHDMHEVKGTLKWLKEVHSHAREAGFELDLRVGSALVNMYAKSGNVYDARVIFDRMDERDLFTWTVMIGGLAQHGRGGDAYELFIRMQQEGFKPDAVTYVSILNACASAGALEWVKEVHSHALKTGLESDVRVGNALVHMYAKCGSIDDARLVFDRMKERDVITWNVMIGGLAQHGCGFEALEVFRNMNAAGVKPDGCSFVALLSACSHAGLVDEGRRLFLAMSQDYGIVPSVVHWTCLVDILGRAGHLQEAKLLIDNMPVEPDGATWGALLGACKSYGDVELGELAAKECVKLEPNNASTYVILSNIYAAAEKWKEVSLVRIMMQERGIRKEPGRSWIEVDNKIHSFVVGDTSHPETKEIFAELSRLTEEIKADGYLPDTRFVLHDVDKKDKEFSLCSHSEKLAIAYGLIHTPSSKPVRVYKNVRVCSDCHTTTKLISKVTRKEIVVRDANRFHHFKDGLSSCKDYW